MVETINGVKKRIEQKSETKLRRIKSKDIGAYFFTLVLPSRRLLLLPVRSFRALLDFPRRSLLPFRLLLKLLFLPSTREVIDTPLFFGWPYLLFPAGRANEPAGRANEPAGRANEPAGCANEPVGCATEPVGCATEPAGRVMRDAVRSLILKELEKSPGAPNPFFLGGIGREPARTSRAFEARACSTASDRRAAAEAS